MKIILISIGTRGDIEPFVAIAEELINSGQEVICAFPEQFGKIVEEIGAAFFPLKKEFLDMLESDQGRIALGGGTSFIERVKAMYQLYKMNRVVSYEMFLQQHELLTRENPDLVLHSLKAMYPIWWHIKNPGKVVQVSPIPCVIHPRTDMASIFLNGKNYGPAINKWSYRFSRRLSMAYTKRQLKQAGIAKISTSDMERSLINERFIYTISPALFEASAEWPEHVRVYGYQERNKQRNWSPPAELEAFLQKHQNPLFITFGSMTNPNPAEKTRIVLETLKELQQPAIINTAAGGLIQPAVLPETPVYFVNDIPYDWILPKVRAVVHHGGAGTTHLALKYGRPSMIIPHIPDQHLWNRIISMHGAGPEGPSIRKFSKSDFSKKMEDLVSGRYDETAKKIGMKLQSEDFTKDLLNFLINNKNHETS